MAKPIASSKKNMQVIIIEDEPLAATHLSTLISECDAGIEVIAILDSVTSAETWFKSNVHPPLVFMDVHLGDGICFEIFNRVTVSSFIIFTTAYDQYALQAFKVNSVDYLLKPLTKKALCAALDKYKIYVEKEAQVPAMPDISQLLKAMQSKTPEYKERFVVKVGAHIRPVKTNEIVCFYSFEKATYLVTQEGKNYLIDYALDKLEDMLNPADFFRISRKYIVAIGYIQDVVSLGPSRVKVKVSAGQQEDMTVSRDKIKSFKNWMEG